MHPRRDHTCCGAQRPLDWCSLASNGLGMVQEEPDLFRMVRVGLGALGVVIDLTLQCVPAHKLVEQTYVTTAQVGP